MGVVHQMGVDFAGRGGRGMAQSFADVEQRDALEGGHSGEGVAKAVKGDSGQIVLADKAGEGQREGVGGVRQKLVVQDHKLAGFLQPPLPIQLLLALLFGVKQLGDRKSVV